MISRRIVESSIYIYIYMQCLGIHKSKRENVYKLKRDTTQLATSWMVYRIWVLWFVKWWALEPFVLLLLQIYNLFLLFLLCEQIKLHHSFYHGIQCIICPLPRAGCHFTPHLSPLSIPLLPIMKLILECKAATDLSRLISDHPPLSLFYLWLHTFHVQKHRLV